MECRISQGNWKFKIHKAGGQFLCDRGLSPEMKQKLFCQDELTEEHIFTACLLTARQYGEVVLPDASRPEGSIPESGYKVSEAGKGGYGTCFCSPGTKFVKCWRDPGTSLIGATSLSPVTELVAGIAQCRVRICLEARNLSRYIGF